MDRKILFFDIDGTLVPVGTKQIPESAVEAIRRARANGHLCMINTGRTRRLVVPQVTELCDFDGLLLGCGTEIAYEGEQLFHKTFTLEESQALLDALKHYQVDAILEGSVQDYAPRASEVYTEEFLHFSEQYRNRNYDTFDHAPGNFDKLFVYTEEKSQLDGMKRDFGSLLDFVDRENGYHELVPKGYSKATAIERICAHLGISHEQTVAIGDSSNDLPMLTYAHTAIAMGNSTQVALDVADYVTAKDTEDGIYKALDWLGVL